MSQRSKAEVFPGLPVADKQKILKPLREKERSSWDSLPNKLIAEACKLYGITEKQIHSRDRYREIVEARHICMYILSTYSHFTLNTIGKEIFKRFDHTTIIHAKQTINNLMQVEPKMVEKVQYLKQFVGL